MKKKKLNRLLKFGILLFGVSFFVSCNKDDDLTSEQNKGIKQTEFKITKIGKSKFEKNTKLKSKLTKLSENLEKSNSNIQNKTVVSNEYGFTIDTDQANYIESADASYHSYTFYIQRDIETDALENLLFSLKPDGTYKISLIAYNTTAQEKEDVLMVLILIWQIKLVQLQLLTKV